MMDEIGGYAVSSLRERRIVRVGVCAVLEIEVIYPALSAADPTCGQEERERFNDAYRRMAEAFLYWGENAFGEQAGRELGELGAGAAYRFDRRILTCTMVAEVDGEAGRITVRRAVRLGRRRGGDQVILPETEDVWRLPEMTLSVKPRRKRNDDGADARGEEKT